MWSVLSIAEDAVKSDKSDQHRPRNRSLLLAARGGHGIVVVVVARGVEAETTTGESQPESALVGAPVADDIGLDPGVTGIDEGRVARLQGERIDEEVEEDDVPTLGAVTQG